MIFFFISFKKSFLLILAWLVTHQIAVIRSGSFNHDNSGTNSADSMC